VGGLAGDVSTVLALAAHAILLLLTAAAAEAASQYHNLQTPQDCI
jgi:hypothetical protein